VNIPGTAPAVMMTCSVYSTDIECTNTRTARRTHAASGCAACSTVRRIWTIDALTSSARIILSDRVPRILTVLVALVDPSPLAKASAGSGASGGRMVGGEINMIVLSMTTIAFMPFVEMLRGT